MICVLPLFGNAQKHFTVDKQTVGSFDLAIDSNANKKSITVFYQNEEYSSITDIGGCMFGKVGLQKFIKNLTSVDSSKIDVSIKDYSYSLNKTDDTTILRDNDNKWIGMNKDELDALIASLKNYLPLLKQ